jgi:hypothetical protein
LKFIEVLLFAVRDLQEIMIIPIIRTARPVKYAAMAFVCLVPFLITP